MESLEGTLNGVLVSASFWLAVALIVVGSILASVKALVHLQSRSNTINGEFPGLGAVVLAPLFAAIVLALPLLNARMIEKASGSTSVAHPTVWAMVSSNPIMQIVAVVADATWVAAVGVTIGSGIVAHARRGRSRRRSAEALGAAMAIR